MTGIQDPYEEPISPDIVVDTENASPEESAKDLLIGLKRLNYL